MVILDITKKNGTKCTRMCDDFSTYIDGWGKKCVFMITTSYKHPHNDERIFSVIKTTIYDVIDVKEVKRV